jgi:hypothetical protein
MTVSIRQVPRQKVRSPRCQVRSLTSLPMV